MTRRPEHSHGKNLIERLQEILRRCEATAQQVSFPGEGGERRFRLWLATEFFADLLGWPATSVVQGERFDLILRDDSGLPVITIETKTPFHKASAKERRDFEKRLAAFPTLRHAIFTNGNEWDRYLIEHDNGKTSVIEDAHFDLDSVNVGSVNSFFDPLKYQGRVSLPEGYRYRISKGEPFIQSALMRLTSDLEACIAELMVYYNGLFHGLREGFAGAEAQSVAEAVYSRWSSESLRVTPTKLAQAVCETLRTEGASSKNVIDCIKSFGFEGSAAQQASETILGLPLPLRSREEEVAKMLWPVFEPYIKQLCAQTAHVQLARVLLYRVGEDEGVFDKRLTGKPLSKILETSHTSVLGRRYPVTEALEAVRNGMQSFLPSIYMLGEFDWWMVKPEYRHALSNAQRSWLLPHDEEIERLGSTILQRLNRYSFQGVDVDIWRNLYENYLPDDERQRLGGFYTPDALVNLVLDLAEYASDAEGLCKLSFIDPSCGSGAFVTTALGRLLAHLDTPMPCHAHLHTRNTSAIQRVEETLRIVSRNVNGVDLHPFASFLTTLNVLFAVLPLYVRARKYNPDFVIDLNIFAWDTLEPPSDQPKDQIPLFAQMNSRIQRTEDAFDRYKIIIREQFDRVFGNPPWGGVLKGPLAPVYDTKKKLTFKNAYPSAAQGKYDVYGLFMERSLRLLREGGEFALITQGTYLEKEWAGGLRAMLSHNATFKWIVDLNPFGNLFFKAMNAPCITIASKNTPAVGARVAAIISLRTTDVAGNNAAERQEYVAGIIRGVAASITASHAVASAAFAEGGMIPQARLQETASSRWNLSPNQVQVATNKDWYSGAELLEVRQGVTPGNCLDVFLLEEPVTEHLQLEKALVHRAIKSRGLARWGAEWHGMALCFFIPTISRRTAMSRHSPSTRRSWKIRSWQNG
ncbi:MAG: Eco57I restriction-modification methylase domain-containing protein [Acidobacteriaceae bacterium]